MTTPCVGICPPGLVVQDRRLWAELGPPAWSRSPDFPAVVSWLSPRGQIRSLVTASARFGKIHGLQDVLLRCRCIRRQGFPGPAISCSRLGFVYAGLCGVPPSQFLLRRGARLLTLPAYGCSGFAGGGNHGNVSASSLLAVASPSSA